MDPNENTKLISAIPGGAAFVSWHARQFQSPLSFHDSEVVELRLNRTEGSRLTLAVDPPGPARLIFVLKDWIDVQLEGFSHQNVIGEMHLRPAEDRDAKPWELGVGLSPGTIELVLEPCFGANGTIRATIERIEFDPGAGLTR